MITRPPRGRLTQILTTLGRSASGSKIAVGVGAGRGRCSAVRQAVQPRGHVGPRPRTVNQRLNCAKVGHRLSFRRQTHGSVMADARREGAQPSPSIDCGTGSVAAAPMPDVALRVAFCYLAERERCAAKNRFRRGNGCCRPNPQPPPPALPSPLMQWGADAGVGACWLNAGCPLRSHGGVSPPRR